MSTELLSGLYPNTFYKQPTPLIFGNFPWEETRIENKDTYEYADMWTVPYLAYTEYSATASSPYQRTLSDITYSRTDASYFIIHFLIIGF